MGKKENKKKKKEQEDGERVVDNTVLPLQLGHKVEKLAEA
jgi:hypothetical protein